MMTMIMMLLMMMMMTDVRTIHDTGLRLGAITTVISSHCATDPPVAHGELRHRGGEQ